MKIEIINAKPERYLRFVTGVGGLTKGQLAVLSSGTAIATSEGVSSAILLGVALETTLATEMALVYPLTGTELEMGIYQGDTIKVFAPADIGKPFDIYVDSKETYLDPNDTTGAFLVLSSYDNTTKIARCRAINSVIYVG